MARRVVPMLHVPDVDATADWYASIGFGIRDRGSDGDEAVWAALTFGDSEVMLSIGGLQQRRLAPRGRSAQQNERRPRVSERPRLHRQRLKVSRSLAPPPASP
jgi:hypothetical protein